MDDRVIMDNVLSVTKGACDLMMHGSIEASTPDVRNAFDSTLDDCLAIQAQIYTKMSQKGWYPSQQADSNQIQTVRQKFSSQSGS